MNKADCDDNSGDMTGRSKVNLGNGQFWFAALRERRMDVADLVQHRSTLLGGVLDRRKGYPFT